MMTMAASAPRQLNQPPSASPHRRGKFVNSLSMAAQKARVEEALCQADGALSHRLVNRFLLPLGVHPQHVGRPRCPPVHEELLDVLAHAGQDGQRVVAGRRRIETQPRAVRARGGVVLRSLATSSLGSI